MKIEQLREQAQAALVELGQERDAVAAKLYVLDAEIRELRRFAGTQRPATRRGEVMTDAHKAAGPGVIAAVREEIERIEQASQAAITKATGKHSGSVSWALKALEKDGVIEATGERERGSKVYRLKAPVVA